MRTGAGTLLWLFALVAAATAADLPGTKDTTETITRIYAVADLLSPRSPLSAAPASSPATAPSPATTAASPSAPLDRRALAAAAHDLMQYLKQHLDSPPGEKVLAAPGAMAFDSEQLTLIVRLPEPMHADVGRLLKTLRSEQAVSIAFHCQVLTGPRAVVRDLAASFEGEFGKLEAETLEQAPQLRKLTPAAATANDRQTIAISCEGRQLLLHGTIAEGRRAVLVKIAEGGGDPHQLVGSTQTMTIHVGRFAAFYFEAAGTTTAIPPAGDTIERLVLVTPRVIVQEEEEETFAEQVTAAAP